MLALTMDEKAVVEPMKMAACNQAAEEAERKQRHQHRRAAAFDPVPWR